MIEMDLHGLRIAIPEGWENSTVYRFAIKDEEEIELPPVVQVHQPSFRPNVIFTKYNIKENERFETVFLEPNKEQMKKDKTFHVVSELLFHFKGHRCISQDINFLAPPNNVFIFQRQIALDFGEKKVVLITITSNKNNLDSIAKKIGF